MSAWMVSRAHIDLLVQALGIREIATLPPDEVGRTLWRENLASIQYLYPNDADGDRPGPMDFRDSDVDTYTYRAPSPNALFIDDRGIMWAAGCFDYQSCEHPGWTESLAHQWVHQLFNGLKTQGIVEPSSDENPRYPWGYEEEHVHPRADAPLSLKGN